MMHPSTGNPKVVVRQQQYVLFDFFKFLEVPSDIHVYHSGQQVWIHYALNEWNQTLRSISEKMLIMFSFFSTSTVAWPKMNEFNAALAFSL